MRIRAPGIVVTHGIIIHFENEAHLKDALAPHLSENAAEGEPPVPGQYVKSCVKSQSPLVRRWGRHPQLIKLQATNNRIEEQEITPCKHSMAEG
jgi:hypothetical protein